MADHYEASYIYEETRYVEGTLNLDSATVQAYRNAITDTERFDVIGDLVAAAVDASAGTGNFSRNISFQVFKNDGQP